MKAIETIEQRHLVQRPELRSGDTVKVHVKVREGEKERIQVFEGMVIGMHRGGARATFTVRKVSFGQGVERIFPLHSPTIAKVDVIRSAGTISRVEIADRTGLTSLSRFVDGIVVAVERGTPLADVLRAQAQDVRESGRRAVMDEAGRKEIGMMVPVVFLILPVTVLFAIYPGVAFLRLAV